MHWCYWTVHAFILAMFAVSSWLFNNGTQSRSPQIINNPSEPFIFFPIYDKSYWLCLYNGLEYMVFTCVYIFWINISTSPDSIHTYCIHLAGPHISFHTVANICLISLALTNKFKLPEIRVTVSLIVRFKYLRAAVECMLHVFSPNCLLEWDWMLDWYHSIWCLYMEYVIFLCIHLWKLTL